MDTKKLIRWLLVIIGVLVIMNISLIGWLLWGDRRGGRSMNGPLALQYLEKELKLSKQQREQVMQLREEIAERGRPLDDSVRKLRQQLFLLTKEPETANPQVAEISRKLGQLIAELETARFDHFRKIRRICTPQQQVQLDEILKELAQRQRSLNGRPGMGGGPPDGAPPPPGGGPMGEGGPPPGNHP